MKKMQFSIVLILLSCSMSACSEPPTLFGKWQRVNEESTDIVTWRYRTLELDIRQEGDQILLLDNWMQRGKLAFVDSLACVPDADPVVLPVTRAFWPPNWYMGVLAKIGSEKRITASWLKLGRELELHVETVVQTSQGEHQLTTTRRLTLGKDANTLIMTESRSTRPTEIRHVFKRTLAP